MYSRGRKKGTEVKRYMGQTPVRQVGKQVDGAPRTVRRLWPCHGSARRSTAQDNGRWIRLVWAWDRKMKNSMSRKLTDYG